MSYMAAVIAASDKGGRGARVDTSGPAVCGAAGGRLRTGGTAQRKSTSVYGRVAESGVRHGNRTALKPIKCPPAPPIEAQAGIVGPDIDFAAIRGKFAKPMFVRSPKGACRADLFRPFLGTQKGLTYFKTASRSRVTVPSSRTKQGMPMPPFSRMSA